MKKVSLTKMSPLRPFQIDVRDKQRVREILFKLEIDTIGWNLPALLEKYCFAVDQSYSEEYHQTKMLTLVAILLSGPDQDILDEPAAVFHENKLDPALFAEFCLKFVAELKDIICGPTLKLTSLLPDAWSFRRALHGEMTSFIYAKLGLRNHAISVISISMLILLANYYSLSFCETSGSEIVGSLRARLLLS